MLAATKSAIVHITYFFMIPVLLSNIQQQNLLIQLCLHLLLP